MIIPRVIPCLLLNHGGLVKTVKFGKQTYVGDPINAIRIFNEKEVDELLLLDIMASREKCSPNYSLIEQIAGECFMPLTYGGGIATVEQARQLFSLGVEKICLQTAVINNFNFIRQLSEQYGSQSIVISVDVKKDVFGKYHAYSSASGRSLPGSWLSLLVNAVEYGAGEILLNAIHRDGLMNGMDIDLIRTAASILPVPLVAIGGVASLGDIKLATSAGASAVSAGAFFVFQGPHRAVLITYPGQDDLTRLFR
jgi:cyclase